LAFEKASLTYYKACKYRETNKITNSIPVIYRLHRTGAIKLQVPFAIFFFLTAYLATKVAHSSTAILFRKRLVVSV